MDPKANLEEQRRVATRILELVASGYYDAVVTEIEGLATRLAELVQALDQWRSKGGVDPYREDRAAALKEAADFLLAAWLDNQTDSSAPGYAQALAFVRARK